MTIEIKDPKLEALIQERLKSGAFHDIEELLTKALEALAKNGNPSEDKRPKQNLAEFLLYSPLRDSGLKIERPKDYPRPIELGTDF